jgi:hypothetical protein
MKLIIILSCLFALAILQAIGQPKGKFNKKGYQIHVLSDSLLNQYHKIAILPFQCSLPLSYVKKLNSSSELTESTAAFEMQYQLYSELMKRKSTPNIQIKSIEEINKTLHTHNINSGTINTHDKIEICRILEVDALVIGKYRFDDIGSAKENITSAIVLQSIGWGASIKPTRLGTLLIQIIDSKDEEVSWELKDSQALMPAVQIEDLKKWWIKITVENFPY